MREICLHHYQGSPYAEKIRLILGYKKLPWRSVEIPALPARPSLKPVLGAYRRTPVLQIGSDFFCDTRLIAEALEQIAPEPTIHPINSTILSTLITGWVEPRLFLMTGMLRFQSVRDIRGVFAGSVNPAKFTMDRIPFIRPAADGLRFVEVLSSARDHVRSFLEVLEDVLRGGSYLGGDQPAIADFAAYHTVWWLRCTPAHDDFLQPFCSIQTWADRMGTIGYGEPVPMSAEAALAQIALSESSVPYRWSWPEVADDRIGRPVSIVPDDYGRNPFDGILEQATRRHVTIAREVPSVGKVRVHFPRLGYEIVVKNKSTWPFQSRLRDSAAAKWLRLLRLLRNSE